MPTPEAIRKHRSLKMLSRWLHDANLWHFNRYSVSRAFQVGLFAAFVPLPSQMLIAGGLAIWRRANLPISVALVWISNPFTLPFICGGAYMVGAKLMQRPLPENFIPTWQWLQEQASTLWQPFLLGCLVCGLVIGFVAALLVRVAWRIQVILRWRARARLRRNPSPGN